ncbi:MAG: hypothetical protein P8X55_06775 [Desulfosarcinaceae bacterium]
MVNGIMSTGYAQPVIFSKQNISPSPTDSSPSSRGKTGSDTINISSKAKLLSSLFPNRTNGSVSIEDIEASLSNAASFVEKRMQSLYGQLGIQPDSRIEFSVGYDGNILANGPSPESDHLAQSINADADLSNSIRRMSANASLLAAFKRHQEFAAAYAKDPVAAVERYGYLLEDGHGYNVLFSMQDGHIRTKVEYI